MISIVTGGAGFIGSHLTDLLIQKKHKVYIVDNLSTGSKENINQNAVLKIRDILDRNWLISFFKKIKPNWVFHLAALPRIQPSFDEPELHDDVNVRGSLNVIHAVRNINIKALVYASSSAIYGNPELIPTPEIAPANPLSPYALQKYTAERYFHIFAGRFNLPIVSLRYFNPYGPRSFNEKNPYNAYTSVVGIFKSQKENNMPLTITGNGRQERDFIHVKDVALATLFVASKISKCRRRVFNVGAGVKTSIVDLAKMFKHRYVFIPKRLGEAKITYANIAALEKIGWKPKYNLQKSILTNDI